MSTLLRSDAHGGIWFGAVLAGACLIGAPSRADTCTNGDVQSAQANTATQADIQLMEQAGTFVFGTVMDVAGAGSVESVFAAALGQGTSSASTDVVGAEIACQQAEITQITIEVATLQTNLANLAAQLANQVNADLANNIATDNQRLQTDVAALNPLAAGGSNLPYLRSANAPRAPGAPSTPKVDLNTARVTAVDAKGLADLYLQQFQNRWIGDDIDSKGAPPTAHFEPYPALHTYFLALQVWMTAMSLEAADLGASGFAKIKAEYGADLERHRNFLKTRASGGIGASNNAGDSGYDPLPDQITKQVSCVWNLSNQYPTGTNNQCRAYPTCSDQIQPQKVWKTSQTFTFSGTPHQMCQIDQASLPPIDVLAQIQQHYGLNEVTKMAQMVDSMYRYGSMSLASAQTSVGFGGGGSGAMLSVYDVDENGTVFHVSGAGNQPIGTPQPITKGWSGLRALLPGGGSAFYTVTQNGALNWYGFESTSSAPTGPVQLASNFGNYRSVIGGGDGVIYAIGPDGTLTWYRHNNLAAGGGPSALSAPKTVGSGWGQFSFVFSAGSGVIYAVQSDGTLLWYRHLDYLTGDSLQAPTAPAATAPAQQNKALGTRLALEQKVPTRPQAHWEGPIKVASGWTGLRSVIAAGNGVILAVKTDGTLLWFKHDDYLSGQSTTAATTSVTTGATPSQNPSAPFAQTAAFAQTTPNASAPNWGSPAGSSSPTATAWGQGGRSGGTGSSAPGWGTPAAFGTPTSLGSPAGGSSPPGPSGTASALSRSRTFGGQGTTPMAGTPAATALTASSLNSRTAAGSTATNAAAQAHFEGPVTIGSGWQKYELIAAVLPTTVNAPIR